MSHEDRGHHFSDRPITLMDLTMEGWFGRTWPVLMAPGPPAVFVLLCEAITGHVRDELDWCYSSIFPMSAVLLLWSWVSGGSQSLRFILKISQPWCDLPLALYFFYLEPSIILCPIFFDVLLSHLLHFHTVHHNPSWGKFVRWVWPNLHIYKLWAPAVQQTGPTAGLKPLLWSRVMTGPRMAHGF